MKMHKCKMPKQFYLSIADYYVLYNSIFPVCTNNFDIMIRNLFVLLDDVEWKIFGRVFFQPIDQISVCIKLSKLSSLPKFIVIPFLPTRKMKSQSLDRVIKPYFSDGLSEIKNKFVDFMRSDAEGLNNIASKIN